MSALADSQHEAFAQARFSGKPLVEAHYAAGYAGDKTSASNLGQRFEIKERIAELYREAAAQTVYEKTHAVQDLLAIIHACPSEAAEDHPLCEVRMGKDGPHYRFPPKLQAVSRLIKLMGWSEPVKVQVELKDNFTSLLAEIRKGHRQPQSPPTTPLSPDEQPPSVVARHSDVETQDCAPRHPDSGSHDAVADAPSSSKSEAHSSTPIGPIRPISPIPSHHLSPPPQSSETSSTAPPDNAHPPICQKEAVIRDLVTIILAPPSAAGPDHPLCEMRMSAWGPYHRFPSKLSALTLLIKMLGWETPPPSPAEHDPDAGFKILKEALRQRS